MSINLEPVVQLTIAISSEGCEGICNVIRDGLLREGVSGWSNEVTDGLRRADNSLVLNVDDLSSGVGPLWSDRRVEGAELRIHGGGLSSQRYASNRLRAGREMQRRTTGSFPIVAVLQWERRVVELEESERHRWR
jgi:hypothetical protein